MRLIDWDGTTALTRPEWQLLEAGKLQGDAPDQHLQLWNGDEFEARASVWFHGPNVEGSAHTGLIGHYAAQSTGAGRTMLEAACEALQGAGCDMAIGPMDGSTWKSYRLVSDAGNEAPFFLEPRNPHDWNLHFLESGFDVLASYHSSLSLNPTPDPRVPDVRERLLKNGITTRTANPARLEVELNELFEVALESFSENFLYTPISKEAFLQLYQPLLGQLPPQFIRIAEHDGRAVGFAFAVPDMLRARQDTLILKTVGVRRGRVYAGLGRLLGDELHDLARAAGMPRVIHALMYDANVSANSSARTSAIIRRYALYARKLT
jgi:GNAT superfamily N-acetyltransferase